MINYEDMPESAQKTYRMNNAVRKFTMKLTWFTIPLVFILCCKVSIEANAFPKELLTDLEVGLFIGSAIHGLIHSGCIIKIAYRKVKDWALTLGAFLGLFALIPILLIIIGVPYLCAIFGGIVFEIIDTIRYFKKMPLVYKWEHKHLLNE